MKPRNLYCNSDFCGQDHKKLDLFLGYFPKHKGIKSGGELCDGSLNKSTSSLSDSKQFWIIYQNPNELSTLIELVNNGSNRKLSFSEMFKSAPIIWVGHS